MNILICENFYSYKNKMPEKDLNLEENVDVSDLSSISLDDESLNDIDEILDSESKFESDTTNSDAENPSYEASDQEVSSPIDESVFLDSWDSAMARKNVIKDDDNFWSYLRRFFFSATLTLLWVLAIALLYSFSTYIKQASKTTPDSQYASYVQSYKEKYGKVREFLWMTNNYSAPNIWDVNEVQKVNEIINATDIDYISKKDLLSKYASDLVRNAEDRADYVENLKQDIAKQWFLPEELEILLSEDQAIDTIQRSLNALEVIKFSTATKVFSYMNTALTTISEMIRIGGSDIESLRNLFIQLSSRWEKDISSYVYMCYLNPFETNANCDNIWELDLYYNIVKDHSIDIRLFKNAMSAISQLLEKEDTSLFSITFNGFNAKDKSIQFNIEVYTNQEDEKSLMQQWKRNPNIFILTNIINLLKQSTFIIGAEINTKEINVDTKTITQWGLTRKVNYSTMDFGVPIQKNTEREIFDYIDIESMAQLLSDRWFNESKENETTNEEIETEDVNNEEIDNEETEKEEVNNDEIDNEENETEDMWNPWTNWNEQYDENISDNPNSEDAGI